MQVIQKGTIKRIHVDQRLIAKARKEVVDIPTLTVQTSHGSIKARRVQIDGPSTVVQRLNDPLSCGARVWIETHAQVVIT